MFHVVGGLYIGERRTIINSKIWNARLGPLVSFPQVGSLVVYFPQGHSEWISTYISCYQLVSMNAPLVDSMFILEKEEKIGK